MGIIFGTSILPLCIIHQIDNIKPYLINRNQAQSKPSNLNEISSSLVYE